jgi:molecular chaperone GrpE
MTDSRRTPQQHSHEHRQADPSPGADAPGEEKPRTRASGAGAAQAEEGTSESRAGGPRADGKLEPAPCDADFNGDGADVQGDLDELVKTSAQRDEYLALAQRTQADFENYRKRIARLQEEQSNRAAASLVEKLLPVLDALDLAEAHLNQSLEVSESGKALRASRAMLTDLLAKEGLERVDQAEVPFDPSVHDAVAHSEGDCGENGQTMVEEVLRSGYRWRGQVLRPAMVRVRG